MPSIKDKYINMICKLRLFIPLGTQKFPFNRLIDTLNKYVKEGLYLPEEILIQSSVYEIEPLFLHKEIIPIEQFNKYLNETPIIITHSGVNSIISCMNLNKKFIVVPRLKEYGEHIDNHQVEIAELMENKYHCLVVKDMSDLYATIQKAPEHSYLPWISNKSTLIAAIKKII